MKAKKDNFTRVQTSDDVVCFVQFVTPTIVTRKGKHKAPIELCVCLEDMSVPEEKWLATTFTEEQLCQFIQVLMDYHSKMPLTR